MILKIMHDKNPIAQSEVVMRTGLQASTVFRIFRALEQRKLIQETESKTEEPDKKGRKPVFYTVNPRIACAVGIEVTAYGATLLLVDFAGETMVEKNLIYEEEGMPAENMVDSIIDLIDRSVEDSGMPKESLIGIGLGVPGIVDLERGHIVRYARFPGMEEYPLSERIEERFAVPVHVHNNTSVMALAEYRYGRAKGKRSLAAFLLLAGVGGAFIKNGQIFESQGKTCFEAGHMSVDLNSTSLSDERVETVEDYMAEDAILKAVREKTERVKNWKDLLFFLETGDEQILQLMRAQVRILLGAVRNVALLLNPEVILVISRFRSLSQFVAEEIELFLTSVFDPECIDTHKVIPIQYDPLTACRGAVDFVFDDYFGTTGIS